VKTKAIENIERKMEGLDEGSIRYRVLQNVINFKTSWIELGQSLYSVWKDKLYRDWGYLTFEAYASKEVGVRKDTVMKLLKSYYFLEKEEPQYLRKKEAADPSGAASMPSYESVNLLRLAKNKKEIGESDYESLKKNVFERGRDVRDVRKDLTALMRQREEADPQEARKMRKEAAVKRVVATLKALKNDIEISKLLPAGTIKDIRDLIEKLEEEITE
jgi:Xaa-Pro aminopeptidase